MFASPYFDPARDSGEIAIRTHQLLTQIAPDDLIDEFSVADAAPEELCRVA